MLCYMLRLGREIVCYVTCSEKILSNMLRYYNTFLLIAKSTKLYLLTVHVHDLIQYCTFFLDIMRGYNF